MVDENGQVLGAVSRGRAHDGSKILHPVVHLHVFNSKGELDGGRFWSRQEILDNMGKGVFTPNFENEYRKFFG